MCWPCCHVISVLHEPTGSPSHSVTSLSSSGSSRWTYEPAAGYALRLCVDSAGNTYLLSGEQVGSAPVRTIIRLEKLNRSGVQQWIFDVPNYYPYGMNSSSVFTAYQRINIDLDSSDNIYVTLGDVPTDVSGGSLSDPPFAYKYDSTGSVTFSYTHSLTGLAGSFNTARVGRVDASGNLWIASLEATTRINKLDASGASQAQISTGVTSVYDVAFNSVTGKLYITGTGGATPANILQRFPASTGSTADWTITRTELVNASATGGGSAVAIDFDPTNGRIVFADPNIVYSSVRYRAFTVADSSQTVVSSWNAASGGTTPAISGVKFFSPDRLLLARSTSSGAYGILMVDPATYSTVWQFGLSHNCWQVDSN